MDLREYGSSFTQNKTIRQYILKPSGDCPSVPTSSLSALQLNAPVKERIRRLLYQKFLANFSRVSLSKHRKGEKGELQSGTYFSAKVFAILNPH